MELPQTLTAFEWLEDAIDGQIWTYPAIVARYDLSAGSAFEEKASGSRSRLPASWLQP